MVKQPNEPGPGRSTADAAFNAHTKDVAQRNERAQKEARKVRAERERQHIIRHRQDPG